MCAVRFIARVFPPGHESYLRLFGYLHVDYGRLPVTFSSNQDNARLPDPDCLCFTECVARVADMSGAAGAVDELKHDVEKEGSTPDRSPAHLLDQLLAPPATIPEAVQRAVVFYRRVLAQVISTSSIHSEEKPANTGRRELLEQNQNLGSDRQLHQAYTSHTRPNWEHGWHEVRGCANVRSRFRVTYAQGLTCLDLNEEIGYRYTYPCHEL